MRRTDDTPPTTTTTTTTSNDGAAKQRLDRTTIYTGVPFAIELLLTSPSQRRSREGGCLVCETVENMLSIFTVIQIRNRSSRLGHPPLQDFVNIFVKIIVVPQILQFLTEGNDNDNDNFMNNVCK